jgi:hypothetical protein
MLYEGAAIIEDLDMKTFNHIASNIEIQICEVGALPATFRPAQQWVRSV